MTGHIEEGQLLALLHGGEDDDAAAREHLRGCAACAGALAAEAALDHSLWLARSALAPCPGCRGLAPDGETRCRTCGAARRVRDYVIVAVRSKSDRGRVYAADDAGGARVAIKEVDLGHGDPACLEALEREARLLGDLRHPRVPRMIESFVEGEGAERRFYLVQEYVAGETLLERLAHHRFAEDEARDIARQVLDVLCDLQRRSPPIFHRDVKPANLIMRPSGALAVVDFGAARDRGATQGGSLVGTFGYMPTEQLVGIVDATTDLHALGATLLHLLSGRAPWELEEPAAWLQMVQVSPGFRAFLARLTATGRGDRFGTADEALAALDAIGTGALARPARRGRRAGWAGGAITAATALGYAGFRAAADVSAAATGSWWPGEIHDLDTPLARTFILFAVAGAVLLAVRLVLQAIGGDHGGHGHGGGGDHGGHGHGGHDHGGHDHGGEVLTLQSGASFLLMYGTVGLALAHASPAGGVLALVGGALAGVGAMFGTAALFAVAGRMQSSGTLDLGRAVGQVGTVYLTIPQDGTGVIQVAVQGRLIELPAMTADDQPLTTGSRVRVVMVRDRRTAIVEAIAPQGDGQ